MAPPTKKPLRVSKKITRTANSLPLPPYKSLPLGLQIGSWTITSDKGPINNSDEITE
jgi:hypothetical protein